MDDRHAAAAAEALALCGPRSPYSSMANTAVLLGVLSGTPACRGAACEPVVLAPTAARALVCNETWKVGRGYRIAQDIPACAV